MSIPKLDRSAIFFCLLLVKFYEKLENIPIPTLYIN